MPDELPLLPPPPLEVAPDDRDPLLPLVDMLDPELEESLLDESLDDELLDELDEDELDDEELEDELLLELLDEDDEEPDELPWPCVVAQIGM